MGLNNDQQVFLTQEDQEAHTLKQFQTQSGESFDSREGYDTTIYEVHKQYNLRSRRIDVPETHKQKDTKQPNKAKMNKPSVQIHPGTDPNPNNPTVEDISDNQQPNTEPSTSIPLKGNVEDPPETDFEATSVHNTTPQKEKNKENIAEKENLIVRNTKTQAKKPFDLETEIGKLKISIPLSELAKHDVYRSQISRSLQISENKDSVNLFDD